MTEDDARRLYEQSGLQPPWGTLHVNQRRLIGVLFDKKSRDAEQSHKANRK